ncbi:uncharacterized protein EV154DRAFT_298392 [Mucor mucedo]|uniref:uncharacterized protein n=1 Tax=Mucor mucedo TaxID=29922 RepID=UPI00221E3898|nr:uncharacterized protein EV154DRAFT_298392 [Mucor mucedo]KAI7895900.1 hypothetical protein EV154DRAFT_298392 [Mucor mucedo]
MEELQKECSLCAQGLSQATGLFTESVISGAIFPTKPESYFDYSCIGLTELTAHVGQKQIAILNRKEKEFLHRSDTFTHLGFWRILSNCVGGKSSSKSQHAVITFIKNNLEDQYKHTFVSNPTIAYVCRQYYVNFTNLWTFQKYMQDLKVVITLTIRANLCRQRFFSKSSTVSSKAPSPNRSSSAKKKTNRLFLMNELFDCLLIHNQHKKSGKLFVIENLVEKLFQSADTATNVERAITGMDPPSLDVSMFSLENENELEDEEDLVVTSFSDFDDVKAVTLDYAQKDLTAKEVRALSAVCIMLIQSWNTEEEVDADNIFEKSYCNSQESIPRTALTFCAKMVNGLIKMRCKKEEECLGSFFWNEKAPKFGCGIRQRA